MRILFSQLLIISFISFKGQPFIALPDFLRPPRGFGDGFDHYENRADSKQKRENINHYFSPVCSLATPNPSPHTIS